LGNDSCRPRYEYLGIRIAATAGHAWPDFSNDTRRDTAQLCVSGDIYAEYEEVIQRPKFNRSGSVIEHALRAVRQNGFWIKPSEKVRACSDPDDDIFLECAQAAHAHYIVTGNSNHFPSKWADTLIVTARQFLDAVEDIREERD
jgi:uncharacterized protein